MKEKLLIRLWDLGETMMIVKAETGLIYENQVHGHGCFQQSQEGYLVPVPFDLYNFGYQQDFQGFTEGLADEFDAYMAKWLEPIRIDREMLSKCYEAWVHVVVSEEKSLEYPRINPCPAFPYKAVLTWENSD